MEWSGIGFLGIIIVKNGTIAANRINGGPSEREGLGSTGLLTHDVGKEWRCGGGDSGDFGRILVDRSLDRI